MTDAECVTFLQEVLPVLRLRWPGFRKARGQVRKRLQRRLAELGLPDLAAYRSFLQSHPEEWAVLEAACRISISRFYRDRRVFDELGERILPELAHEVADRGEEEARVWSAGCASGEEPYTLAILWKRQVQPRFPQLQLLLLATDADAQMLARARKAHYPASSIKDLPKGWLGAELIPSGEEYRAHTEILPPIGFSQQDIRQEMPDGPFQLVLCRNLVFTYFAEELQKEVLREIVDRLVPGGYLVVGVHEQLPAGAVPEIEAYRVHGIFRIREAPGER